MNSTINLSTVLVCLVCTLAILANDPFRDRDVVSALEQVRADV